MTSQQETALNAARKTAQAAHINATAAAWGRVEVSLEKYENESSPYLQSIFWDDYLRRLADYNNV